MPKFLKDNKCCNPSPNGGSSNRDCVEDWKVAYDAVCLEYNIAAAAASQGEALYINSAAWELKLEKWFAAIKETDEKAESIVFELGFFVEQIKIVCTNSDCTIKALQVLLCKVKAIFDCLYSYDESSKGIKEMIDDLKMKIECLESVDGEAKAEVAKCIAEYESKITAVCECQDAVLKKLLDTYKCAQLLFASICEEECGLKKIVDNILDCFDGKAKVEDEHCKPGDSEEQDDETDEVDYPCNTKDIKKSTMQQPTFPIKDGIYYVTTEEQLNTAKDKSSTFKSEWTEVRKLRDKLLARKTSLAEAIKASEAAESGK